VEQAGLSGTVRAIHLGGQHVDREVLKIPYALLFSRGGARGVFCSNSEWRDGGSRGGDRHNKELATYNAQFHAERLENKTHLIRCDCRSILRGAEVYGLRTSAIADLVAAIQAEKLA